MNEHLDHLYGYAMVLTRSKTDAEDLVQETYRRAVKAIRSLQTVANMKIWLFKILRNIWRRRPALSEITLIDDRESGASLIAEPLKDSCTLDVDKLDVAKVREGIERLPLILREIILLREYEELSYGEIASLTGCPIKTVMLRLARARAKLRTLLASYL